MSRNHLLPCLFGITAYLVASIVPSDAIIGGQKADEFQFPYQVSIFYEDKSNECGGVILGDFHILTAASCVVQANGKFNPERLFVLAGTNNLRRTKRPAVTIEVERIFVPSEFKGSVSGDDGNIAVLELSKSLALRRNKKSVRKIKMPKRYESYEAQTAKITGFGWDRIRFEQGNKYGNNSNGNLQFAEALVLSNDDCLRAFPATKVSQKDLCARVKQTDSNRHGVCNGDAGSPLVVNDSVIGILGRVPWSCEERVKSGIYTRVSRYLAFINNAINGKLTRNMYTYEASTE